MMVRRTIRLVGLAAFLAGGCTGVPLDSGASTVEAVADKAVDVAQTIGGVNGFGGTMMTGYMAHGPQHMGFVVDEDLADPDGIVTVVLRNDSAEEATFIITYFASHVGFDDESTQVVVAAGTQETIELPCSEIVGLGPLGTPGGAGCVLSNGFEIANTYAVPVFLHLDFECGETREFVLQADADDLDGDGDVEELVVLSDGFLGHMQNGGPTGHAHDNGMMGPHMMGGMMFAP